MTQYTTAEDSRLTPREKETTFTLTKSDDRIRAFTAERGLMNRLLAHPESELETATLYHDDEYENVRDVERGHSGVIVNLTVTLPVGCFTVSRDPRNDNQHAKIVTESVLTARTDGAGGGNDE